MTGLLSDLIFPSPPQRQLSLLADALRHPPVRQPALPGLAQCLAQKKQTYEMSVEMDIETKLAFDRGETISVSRCR